MRFNTNHCYLNFRNLNSWIKEGRCIFRAIGTLIFSLHGPRESPVQRPVFACRRRCSQWRGSAHLSFLECGKYTWEEAHMNPKQIDLWKTIFLCYPVVLSFQVNLQGCDPAAGTWPKGLGSARALAEVNRDGSCVRVAISPGSSTRNRSCSPVLQRTSPIPTARKNPG